MGRLFFNMVASGSGGNCSLVYDDDTFLIVDFGISFRSLNSRLGVLHKHPDEVSLMISHEHSDHSSGIPVLRKKLRTDIYSRRGTIESLRLSDGYEVRSELVIGDFRIRSVDVSHDAAEPVAFIISSGGRKISIISDLGFVNEEVVEEARGSDILALEANHDLRMLLEGPYSPHLKSRIEGRMGHLSNIQSAEAVAKMCKPETTVILTHLSQENNKPELALSTVRTHLSGTGIKYASIEAATQASGSSLYSLDKDSSDSARIIL